MASDPFDTLAQAKAQEAIRNLAVAMEQGLTGPTTTLPAGSDALLTIDTTGDAPQLLASIPRGNTGATGPKGDKGDKGDTGDTGPTFSPDEAQLSLQQLRPSGGLYLSMLDSLTAGAAGGTWRTMFNKIMRANLGDGGPGFHSFTNGTAADQGVAWGHSANTAEFALTSGTAATSPLTKYGPFSPAGTGQVMKAAGDFVAWQPASQWKTARVFYIKGPDQAAFNWRLNVAGVLGPVTTVDCYAASYQLAYFDVVSATTSTVGLRFDWAAGTTNAAGDAVLCGADFVLDATKYRQGTLAVGGRWQRWVAQQDQTAMRAFYAATTPTHVFHDGGMNDRTAVTDAQFNSDLNAIVDNIQAASPASAITIVQSLEPGDAGNAGNMFRSYTARKIATAKAKNCAFLDVRHRLGTSNYAAALAAGFMVGDGIHPAAKGVAVIAQLYARFLGANTALYDPGGTAYVGGGGGGAAKVYSGTLTEKNGVAVTAATRQVLWKLGLTNAFPTARLVIEIVMQRSGTSSVVAKRAEIALTNGTTANQAALCKAGDVPTVTTTYSVAAGNGSTFDFTIDVTINAGWAEVGITCAAYAGQVSATGRYLFTSLTQPGPSVFEN